MRHWRREGPPVYVSVAAYLGLRQPGVAAGDVLAGDDLVRFLEAFPAGGQLDEPATG
jgi:hypothetical protein